MRAARAAFAAGGLIAVAIAVVAAAVWFFVTDPGMAVALKATADPGQIARGRYLAVLGDCTACHTRSGGAPFSGGDPINTGFGSVAPPNITPDADTGIGKWTETEFVRAMTRGAGPGGKFYYPALPYNHFTNVTDQDLVDILAYLRSLPPVHNAVRSDRLWFPFRIRPLMIGWNLLFLKKGPLADAPNASPAWLRGRYIVEGLGHCGSCHTSKNLMGGDIDARHLGGFVVDGYYAPPLDGNIRSGLGAWSAGDIVRYLKTGATNRAIASGPMAEAVTHSTSLMTQADLSAIATYLKSLPANPGKAVSAQNPADPVMIAGRGVYLAQCSACHASDGIGAAAVFPRLAGSAQVQSPDPAGVLRAILHGQQGVATPSAPTGPAMPAFDWKLTDDQIAAVATYIRNAWGNVGSPISAKQARKARAPT